MSLNWNWKEKCGELHLLQTHDNNTKEDIKIDLYQGNALLIMIHEFKDEFGTERYELFNFFASKEHMKRCLGLKPKEGYKDNILDKAWLKPYKITIYKNKNSYSKDIIESFAKAFNEFTIEVKTK